MGRRIKLTNTYCGEWADVWMQLAAEDVHGLYPRFGVAVAERGRQPNWWREIEEDLETVLGADDRRVEYKLPSCPGAVGFHDTWILWALGLGIAPYQPFLVRFYRPVTYKCGGWDDFDYDVAYEWDLLQIYTWASSKIVRVWSGFLENLKRLREDCVVKLELAHELASRATEHMYIQSYVFRHRNDARPYKEEVVLQLRTTITYLRGSSMPLGASLVSARSERGGGSPPEEWEQVWQKLKERAMDAYPSLSPEILDSLPLVRH